MGAGDCCSRVASPGEECFCSSVDMACWRRNCGDFPADAKVGRGDSRFWEGDITPGADICRWSAGAKFLSNEAPGMKENKHSYTSNDMNKTQLHIDWKLANLTLSHPVGWSSPTDTQVAP